MSQRAMIADGVDLSPWGLLVEGITDHRSGVEVRHDFVATPGRYGQLRTSHRGQVQPRQITVDATLKANSVVQLIDYADELKWRLEGREITLAFSDKEDRQMMGVVLQNPSALLIDPHLIQVAHKLKLVFKAGDPRWHSTAVTSLDFTAAPAQIELGTAPVFPVITLVGAVSAPKVRHYAPDGVTVLQEMSFPTLNLGSGHQLVIDCWDQIITIDGANAADYLDDASDFIEFWPSDVDVNNRAGPFGSIGATPQPAGAACDYRVTYR